MLNNRQHIVNSYTLDMRHPGSATSPSVTTMIQTRSISDIRNSVKNQAKYLLHCTINVGCTQYTIRGCRPANMSCGGQETWCLFQFMLSLNSLYLLCQGVDNKDNALIEVEYLKI